MEDYYEGTILEETTPRERAFLDFCTLDLNFSPYTYQVEFLLACINNKRVTARWDRQSGKSTTVSVYCGFAAITVPNTSIMIIAPTQEQSSEMYSKIRAFIENNDYLREKLVSSTRTELMFDNGSRIKALPCGPEGVTIRGYTANIVIVEEAAYIKDSIVNEVIMPMIAATDGQIIKIGTPKIKNHFYDSCFSDKYTSFHVTWRRPVVEGQITQEFIDEQRELLTDMEFRTEHEAEFVEESDIFFPSRLVQDTIYEELEHNEDYHPKSTYVLGVDLARMGEDESVFIIVEQKFAEFEGIVFVKAIFSTYHKTLTDAVGRIRILDDKYYFSRIYVDETGLGAGVVDVLKERVGFKVEGVKFTIQSKMDLYNNLKLMMEKKVLRMFTHKKLIMQLSDMRYEYTSDERQWKIHHSERGHDDYPDALVLATWHFAKHKSKYRPMIFAR